MLLKGFLMMGFAGLCCLSVMSLAIWMIRHIGAVNTKTIPVRFLAYLYALASFLFAVYWCWLILTSGWELLHNTDGPGPLSALIFPFWAAIGATPLLIGLILFKTVKARRRRYFSPS